MTFRRIQFSTAAHLRSATVTLTVTVTVTAILTLTVSCTKEMATQNKDGPGKKPFVAQPTGSVPYKLNETNVKVDDQALIIASREFMEHGRDRYQIHCLPCHGILGRGDGIIVQRGFPKPPPLVSVAESQRSDDELYGIISNGRGRMAGYQRFINESDRKSIVAYLRVLQMHHSISGGAK